MKYFLTHLLLCVGFIYSFYNDVVEADTFDYYNGGSRYNLRNNDHIGTNFHFKQEDPSPYDYKSPYENEEVPRKQEITYKKVSYLGEDKRSEPEIQRNPMFLENRMNQIEDVKFTDQSLMPYNNFQMRSVYIKGRDDKVLNSKDDLINEDSSKDTKLSHVRLKHSHAEIEELRSKSLPNVDKFSKELSDLILMIIEDIFTTGKINQILNEDKSNIEDLVKDMIVTKLAGRSNQAKPKNETVIEQRKVNEDKLNISKNLAIKKNEEKKGDTSFLMMKEQEKGKKIITLEDAKVQEILLKNAIEISTLFRNDNKSSEHQKSNDLVAVLKKLAADIIELK